MSAVQEAIGQRERALRRLFRWSPRGGRPPELAPPELAPPELAPPELAPPELAPPELAPPELASRWPLLTMPTSLIVYVLVVLACDVALTGWELAGTPTRTGDLLLF